MSDVRPITEARAAYCLRQLKDLDTMTRALPITYAHRYETRSPVAL